MNCTSAAATDGHDFFSSDLHQLRIYGGKPLNLVDEVLQNCVPF